MASPNPVPCVVLDPGGNVVNVIMADPAVDTLEGFTLKSQEQWSLEKTGEEAWL